MPGCRCVEGRTIGMSTDNCLAGVDVNFNQARRFMAIVPTSIPKFYGIYICTDPWCAKLTVHLVRTYRCQSKQPDVTFDINAHYLD